METKQQFDEFIKKEYDRAINYIKKNSNNVVNRKFEPEDILQEVCLKTWKIIVQGNIIDNLSAYIYRSIKNKLIDINRKDKNVNIINIGNFQEESYKFIDLIKINNEQLIKKMDRDLFKKIFIESLSKLPEKYKIVWKSIEINKISYEKLAEDLNETKNNLRVLKHRANDKLKNWITEKMKGELL